MIRILLADDHTILRDGIRALLAREADLQVVGEAANGQALLELLAHTPTDLVLLDVNMPVLDGFAVMPLLRAQFPQVRVLVLSMLDHENYVHRMLEAGALGYVLKNADSTEIIHAIRTVAANQPFLCTEIGLSLLRRLVERTPAPDPLAALVYQPRNGWPVPAAAPVTGQPELSGREREVLQLIAEGLTNQEIADKLFTSKRTIETHRQNIIEKTQTKNTAALIRYAMSTGLIG
ncbi:response regulator [Hymenobacter psychrophilus]|uniref:Two component transcriptional regulator, LuxR family n=1 Tax=Hymenobacter psychrophilus TaxID=651662 RepID=A0A1H3EXW3_9BACT|nr:response regulator transcription factor [Hymenobacter psychrophilus]SDX83367.1 two component transcriptional regulator, LuxR family [Hymenobacter psychrophilus]